MTSTTNLGKLGLLGIVLILQCAVGAEPALANWFDGSSLHFAAGHKLLPGSARTPTPDDLCAIGDSDNDRCFTDATRQVRKDYVLDGKQGHYHEFRPGLDDKAAGNQTAKPSGIR
jgi:hypothetical protein